MFFGRIKFRSSIIWRLLATALIPLVLALISLDFYLTRYTADREREHARERLAAEARILALQAQSVSSGALQQWAERESIAANLRLAFFSASGAIVADSQADEPAQNWEASEPEIQAAIAGREGWSLRDSAFDTKYVFVAIPMHPARNAAAVLRVSVPLRDVDAPVAEVRYQIWLASLIAGVAFIAVSSVMAIRFSRRIRRLQEFAAHAAERQYAGQLTRDYDDELGDFASALNRMAAQTRELLESLQIEAAQRHAMLSSMVEGVLAVDSDMRVTFCNSAFREAFHAVLPVRDRMPVTDLVRDPGLIDLLAKTLATRESSKARVHGATEQRIFEAHVAPIASGPGGGALAMLRDITEIEKLERVRKEFVANVSHELRTPLTAIQGYAETLLDGAASDPENARKFLERIQAHAMRLNNITSDLLILSELDLRRLPARPETVSVASALESAIAAVDAEARVREVAIIVDRIDPAEILGHRLRLEQVFVNLLQNAIKFNQRGGRVRVSCAVEDEQVRVAITDSGIGIPAHEIPRIFERFYRVDKARSRETGGTGLGLSIVKHAVDLMGGSVNVTSQPGHGSTFEVILPLEHRTIQPADIEVQRKAEPRIEY